MAQFYNNEIEKTIEEFVNILKKKDLKLNKLLVELVEDFSEDNKIIDFKSFSVKFRDIYQIDFKTDNALKKQNKINAKKFTDNFDEIKKVELSKKNVELSNEILKTKIDDLEKNSYFKYKKMCGDFKSEMLKVVNG